MQYLTTSIISTQVLVDLHSHSQWPHRNTTVAPNYARNHANNGGSAATISTTAASGHAISRARMTWPTASTLVPTAVWSVVTSTCLRSILESMVYQGMHPIQQVRSWYLMTVDGHNLQSDPGSKIQNIVYILLYIYIYIYVCVYIYIYIYIYIQQAAAPRRVQGTAARRLGRWLAPIRSERPSPKTHILCVVFDSIL